MIRIIMETNKVRIRDFKLIYLILLLFLPFLTYLFTELDHYRRLIAGWETKAIDVFKGNSKVIGEITNMLAVQNGFGDNKKKTPYFSVKPEHCVQTGMRLHCLWAESSMTGVNQHHTVEMACYPRDVVISPTIPKVDPNFSPQTEMLDLEKETLNDPEFVNISDTTDPRLSTYTLVNSKKKYDIGDVIEVRIDMVDGYKRRRTVGGDDVRIFMRSANQKFGIAGSVEDFKNGTYLGRIRLFWPGKSQVYVLLPFTRESRATAFKWRRDYKIIFYYYGQFKKGNLNEYTLCSPYPEIHGYEKICNFTEMNHDRPWFCGQPLNPGLTCEDFVLSNDLDYLEIPMTAGQREMFFRDSTHVKVSGNVEVEVTEGTKLQETIKQPCNKMSPRETWNFTVPYGYFDHRQWINLRCQNTITSTNVLEHLRDTTLTIVGDSTTRQWYTTFRHRVNCQQETTAWTSSKWYDISSCYVKDVNFRLNWYPHVFPFPTGRKEKDGKMNLKSVKQALMEVPVTGKYLLVFHHFAHYIREHYSLFRDVVRSLKPAMRDALKRNPALKIGIKSPHSFHEHPCPSHFSDFPGPLFMDILKSELKEFHDHVWMLNYWEQTLVLENGSIHPEEWVVWENMLTFFGYVL